MIPIEFHNFARELAVASGNLIRSSFCDPRIAIELKSDKTIVTAADRGAEVLMREMIAKRYPHHGIIGEELGSANSDAEFVWVLDPIDGTVSFASGVPLFGTLIALTHGGVPILGVIHQPILEMMMIGDGNETSLNGNPVRTSKVTRVDDAMLLCTDFPNVERYQKWDLFHGLMGRAKTTRGWGDCFGYLQVASGRADIMCDPIMNPWDITALIPVIRGAGGVITDWQGNDPTHAKSMIASANKELHTSVIAALNQGS